MLPLLLVMPALLAGCGDDTTTESGQAPGPSTTAAAAAREYVAQFISNSGYKYAISLSVATQPAVAGRDDCPPATPPVAGTGSYPVTLTVKNEATDKPAPFPPLRIELTSGGAVPPQPVLVRATGTTGTCTFTPRVDSIGPGESAVFRGMSPAIATGAAPGSVGNIEVSASETRFSLAAPVP